MTNQPRPVIIVTGDFVRTGGMDRANFALAEFLADHPAQASHVHLVAHRIDDKLYDHPRVSFYPVPKPLGSYWLAGTLLDYSAQKLAGKIPDARLIVNGGNSLARTSQPIGFITFTPPGTLHNLLKQAAPASPEG